MIDTKKFVLAGNATFTITSRRSGIRFTYNVSASKNGGAWFVKVLTGPDNWTNYKCFGVIANDRFFHSKNPNCKISPTAPSAKAFSFFWRNIDNKPVKLPTGEIVPPMSLIEIHHEGKCCRCGRKLTVPDSIVSGIGPECAEKM